MPRRNRAWRRNGLLLIGFSHLSACLLTLLPPPSRRFRRKSKSGTGMSSLSSSSCSSGSSGSYGVRLGLGRRGRLKPRFMRRRWRFKWTRLFVRRALVKVPATTALHLSETPTTIMAGASSWTLARPGALSFLPVVVEVDFVRLPTIGVLSASCQCSFLPCLDSYRPRPAQRRSQRHPGEEGACYSRPKPPGPS